MRCASLLPLQSRPAHPSRVGPTCSRQPPLRAPMRAAQWSACPATSRRATVLIRASRPAKTRSCSRTSRSRACLRSARRPSSAPACTMPQNVRLMRRYALSAAGTGLCTPWHSLPLPTVWQLANEHLLPVPRVLAAHSTRAVVRCPAARSPVTTGQRRRVATSSSASQRVLGVRATLAPSCAPVSGAAGRHQQEECPNKATSHPEGFFDVCDCAHHRVQRSPAQRPRCPPMHALCRAARAARRTAPCA